MAQATRAAVDHHADLALVQPERGGNRRVVDPVDRLNLQEVVP